MTSLAPSAPLSVADFTFAFNCLGEGTLGERIDAAKGAGFTEIGLSCRWTNLWLADHSIDELVDTLDAAEMRVGELEAIRVMRAEPDPLEDVAALLAERLRPARLQCIGPYDGTIDDAVVRIRRVADRFAEWNVDLVLEPLPFTNVQTPADAADIIIRTERDNVGMCMDVWHLYRMGLPLSHLDGLWPVITTVQINDGTIVAEDPDLYADCLANRRLLGDGEFDLVGLLRARAANRPDSSLSLEIINPVLRSQDAATSARQIADSVTRVVAASLVRE